MSKSKRPASPPMRPFPWHLIDTAQAIAYANAVLAAKFRYPRCGH